MTDVTLAPKFMYPDQREATEGMFGNKYYWNKTLLFSETFTKQAVDCIRSV